MDDQNEPTSGAKILQQKCVHEIVNELPGNLIYFELPVWVFSMRTGQVEEW